MKNKQSVFLLFLFVLLLYGCSEKAGHYRLTVKNDLPLQRNSETVAISRSELGTIPPELFSRLAVRDVLTGRILPVQWIDADQDGVPDDLIFQPELEPYETREYQLEPFPESGMLDEMDIMTFSRFVPERTDDYAWENDRVAFRTYGPVAQRMVEEGVPGGTLTSGMDCWLKRVNYPIIDKWYQKYMDGTGSYHEDTGEGLDDFHVGASRGCGGIGIWDEEKQLLYTSKNFVEWRTMAVGPIRTQFELDYAPWQAGEKMINEKKIISLDLGSNLTRFEVHVASGDPLETLTAGLTLHEKDGQIRVDEQQGWFSYWQPHGDSELGMGIVVEPGYLAGYTEYMVDEADQSHLLVHLKPVDGKVFYYAGFGWKKSGQYASEEEWLQYLGDFSVRLESPLIVEINVD
jgi:hypothetical protein